MMNQNESEQIQGAVKHIRLIENELASGQDSESEAYTERELGLIDDLLTLQMGIGPARRKLATGDIETRK